MIFKKLNKKFKERKIKRSNYTKYSSYRRTQRKKPLEKTAAKQKRAQKVRSQRFVRIKQILLIIAIIGGLGFGIYYIFFSGSMVVEETALFEGNTRIDHDIILSEINVHKGEPLLAINKTELIHELKAKYPEIEHIDIRKRLPNKLYVYITKYPIITNLTVKVENVQRTYLINSEGSIAVADSEDESLPYIVMNREKAYNSKEKVFTAEELESILNAKKLFEQKFNMQILETMYLEAPREYHFLTEKNFYVWMDLTQDYVAQLSKLKAAEQKLNLHSTPLQYIDLRIAGSNGEKVIYK